MFLRIPLSIFRTLILAVLVGLMIGSLSGCSHDPVVPPSTSGNGGDDNGGDDDGDDD